MTKINNTIERLAERGHEWNPKNCQKHVWKLWG